MKPLHLSIIAVSGIACVIIIGLMLLLIVEPNILQRAEIQKNANVTLVLPQGSSGISLSKTIADEIKVVIGQNNTVMWKNNDRIPHNVSIDQGNSSFSHTFEEVGVFRYEIYSDKCCSDLLFSGSIITENLNLAFQPQRIGISYDPITNKDYSDNPKQIKINDLAPNSSVIFVYPYTNNKTLDESARNLWILIRLPAHDGGDKDDISSFRAYSMVDIQLNCIIRYWPNHEWLEDPCHGSLYEPLYGIPFAGPAINYWIKNDALPQLDLGVDSKEYIYVKPPVFDIDKNGLVGYGRKVPADLFEKYGQIGQSHLQQVIRQNE
jgi:Rieske Fe-S protein